METPPPPIVVTLINGTFARDAAWVAPDSPLAQYLRDHLGDTPVVESMRWEGGNSTASRHEGAEMLATRIADVARVHKGSPHFLIAHSHGGNVAVQALRQTTGNVRGLVCLNTPFLHSHPRRFRLFSFLGDYMLTPALPGFVLALYMYFYRYRPMYPDQFVWPLLRSAVWAWPWILIGLALAEPYERLVAVLTRYFNGVRTRSAGVLVPDAAPSVPLLPLTVPGDEAYWWLRLVDTLSIVARLPLYVAIIGFVIALVANNLQGIAAVVGWFLSVPGAGITFAVYSFALALAFLAAYVLALLLMFFVLPLVRGHVLSYGEGPWESILFHTTVKPYAVGMKASSVVRLPARALLMRHSTLYSQQRVAQLITEWVRERMRQ